MKKRIGSLLTALLLCAALILPCLAAGESEAKLNEYLLSGSANAQQWVDETLVPQAGGKADWFILALARAGDSVDLSRYAAALETLAGSGELTNAASRLRVALVLRAAGYESAAVDSLVPDAVGKNGVMCWVFGLHAITNGIPAGTHTAEECIAELMKLRLEDGGWAVTGQKADVDVTAMTVQALAPYAKDAEVAGAVEGALAVLASRQEDNGGFASFGVSNPESAAQVIIALCALGIDPAEDERFTKNGCTPLDGMTAYQLPDGGFAHESGGGANDTSAAQALLAYAALNRLRSGAAPLYEFKDTALVPIPAEAFRTGSGLGIRTLLAIGVGAAALIAAAVLWFTGRRRLKSYITLLLIAAVAIAGIFFLDIRRPEDYYGSKESIKGESIRTVISIRCDTAIGERDFIPADGVILPETEITVSAGSSAYDQLVEAAKQNSIQLDAKADGYVSGLGYLYEFDLGPLSGWMFFVNGKASSVGASDYTLQEGDTVEWRYTRALGEDIGGGFNP